MIIPISFRERFFGLPNPLGGNFAPSTVGAPELTHPVDYSIFKKTKDEKKETKIVKNWHKEKLREAYPDGVGKHLNVPSQSLSDKSILI